MLYLLIIVISNRGRGKLSAFIAAFMATISFDFFFVPPYYSFAIADSQYIVTFIVMAAIGTVFNMINGNLRYQVSKLSREQQHSEWLNKVNEELAAAIAEKQIEELLTSCFTKMFKAHYMLLLPNQDDRLEVSGTDKIAGFDPTIADWVFINNQSAGLNTSTFAASNLMYLPIRFKVRARGVLVIQPKNSLTFFQPNMQQLLDN